MARLAMEGSVRARRDDSGASSAIRRAATAACTGAPIVSCVSTSCGASSSRRWPRRAFASLSRPPERRRRHRSKIPMALVENLVTRIQEIAFTGSDGDVLRLVFGMHEVFQPGKHENGKNGSGGPRPATFVMAQPEPAPEESGQPPA